jgi:hypothetical protein
MQEPRQTKRIPGKYVVYFVIAYVVGPPAPVTLPREPAKKSAPPAPQKPASEAPQ